jgi:adenylosuccinate lyase
MDALHAISPIDGRYAAKLSKLNAYFSEAALIQYRVLVELRYFRALVELPLPQLKDFPTAVFEQFEALELNLSDSMVSEIKEIESETNHDVKAVEYFIKRKFDEWGIGAYKEFIHFGLTSQDINNTAIPLMLRNYIADCGLPILFETLESLQILAEEYREIPMLARTHGQPASPTFLGKELDVFVVRLKRQIEQLQHATFGAKFGGATGNLNAHVVTYPEIDWHSFAKGFVENTLGLTRSYPTTQIDHYDTLSEVFDVHRRINVIWIDFARDIWTYISMDYFKQKVVQGEVGSSAMPHKVNPIDFENAEGNLGLANAIFDHLSNKLPISRLQRDLTDSTVLRNVGVPFAHSYLACVSLQKGMRKLIINRSVIQKDLDAHWEVVAEAIQNILRRENYPKPYEALKALTRGNNAITQETIRAFISELDIPDSVKEEMTKISPHNYTGF